MKKKINSKGKGNRAELELAKILSARFGVSFARVGVSSGARPKQVKLDSMATETLTGDLIVPEGFRFSVECKAVNKDVDLLAESALLDKFLKQAAVDADSIGKMPLLCWKRNRKGWIVALPTWAYRQFGERPQHYVKYAGWVIAKLDILLPEDKPYCYEFWFEK